MNTWHGWLYRKKGSILVICLSVFAIGVLHKQLFWDGRRSTAVSGSQHGMQPVTTPEPASPFTTVPIAAQIDEVISKTRPVLSAEIDSLSASGNFQRAKELLLDRALQAVESQDNKNLALQLSELGELALLQGDIGMAEVYLAEALELYEELQLEVSVADVHVQLGRAHLYARQRARQASDAYDQLLISRWHISQGRFYESEEALQQVVATNLSLNRYGAAASAHETLHRGYLTESNILRAQQSGIEAIKLHAASGNLHDANRLLSILVASGMSDIDADSLELQLRRHYKEYEASVKAIGAARDYGQLYNQLQSRGDAVQAWRFRRKAEESLANASKRAQYRRQADVLSELYRSNSSMSNAKLSLKKADAVYTRYGLTDGLERSRQLHAQIY